MNSDDSLPLPPPPDSEEALRSHVDELNLHCWNSMFDDLETALSVAHTAIQEAESIQYAPGAAFGWLNHGWCCVYLGKSEEARGGIEKALEIYEALDDPQGRTKSLNALGVLYHTTSRFERALDYYTQSLDEARRFGLRDREAATLNNIGEVCADLGNHKEALDYFLKAYDIISGEKNPELRSSILLNIGSAFVRMENFILADEFTRKALEIARSGPERIILAACWDNLGRIERAQGNTKNAEAHFRKSLRLAENVKSPREIIKALLDLGSLLMDRGDLQGALRNLERAASLSEAIHAKALYYSAYERLADTHERLGEHETALNYYRRFVKYEREILSEDTTRKIKDIQIQYEVERTQREAEIYRLRNIELKEKTERLEEMNRQMLSISEIGRHITSSLELETVISTLYESIHSLMVTDVFGLAFYDPESDSLQYSAYIKDGKRVAREPLPLDPKHSFAAWCIRRNSPVFVKDVESEHREYLEGKPKFYGRKPGKSFVFLPLSIENNVIGVLTVQSYAKESYTPRDLRFLTALAPYVAIALENSLIHDRLEALNRELKGEKEQLEKATLQISYLANHDSLTGLPNRRLLTELLRKSFEMARRTGAKVGILYVDLDNFKPINDRFGHMAGDKVLVEISERLKTALRASDTIARVGGDEFVAVLNDVRGRADVESAARKVLEACDAPLACLEESCRVGASMGITLFPDDGDTLDALMQRADSAMYRIKRASKKGYAFFDEKE